MKAIILIAGKGSRLKPLTDYIPKCCMPIAGTPLLHIWIEKLKSAAVTDILINPSGILKNSYPCSSYVIDSIFSSGLSIPSITIVPEVKPLGTAGTIWKNRHWLGEDDFFIIYGDVLTDLSLEKLISWHIRYRNALMTAATYRTDKPQEKGIFRTICHSNSYHVDSYGWATSFVEKPENPDSQLAFAGIAIARPGLLSHITDEDFDLTGDVLTRVVNKDTEHVWTCYDPKVYFKDIGTIPDYLSCQAEWKRLSEKQGVKRCK